jgi:hypothetical protein
MLFSGIVILIRSISFQELIVTTASSILALHPSFVLPIAIGAGLEKTCLINDTSLSTSDLENFARTDQLLLSNDWGK